MIHSLCAILLAGTMQLAPFQETDAGSVPQNDTIRQLILQADSGDVTAQSTLCFRYYYGKGIEADPAKALQWGRMAADKGDRDAQFVLGLMYALGAGVPADMAESVKWHTLAAESGLADAQFLVGRAYFLGDGVPKSGKEAYKWFLKSSQQGYKRAQYNLGVMYYLGEEVGVDYDQARKWFETAARQGYTRAKFMLGKMYYAGEGLPRDIVKANEIFEELKKSDLSEWLQTDSAQLDVYSELIASEMNLFAVAIKTTVGDVPDMKRFFHPELFETPKEPEVTVAQEPQTEPQEVVAPQEKPAKVSKEKVVQGQKIQAKKPKEHKPNVYDKFFAYSGMYSLSYLNAGYMYYVAGQKHLVDFSTLDFRLAVVGVKPLGVELCLGPFDTRVTYKPSVQIYFPVAKWFSIVPYAGLAVDASYVGTFFDKNYEYDKSKDFYMGAIGGIALNLTAIGSGGHFSFALKMEYRHPLIQPEVGTKELTGLYLGAQIQVGSIFKKKKITK